MLEIHSFVHPGQKPHKCTVCEDTFWYKSRLSKHLTQKHKSNIWWFHDSRKGLNTLTMQPQQTSVTAAEITSKTRDQSAAVHRCIICGEIFQTQREMQLHIETTHTDERTHICFLCENGFKTAYTLKTHAKVHIRQGQYACTLCATLFPSESALKNHRCPNCLKKTYMCFLCDRGLPATNYLPSHLRKSHTCRKHKRCTFCGFLLVKEHLHLCQLDLGESHMCSFCGKGPFSPEFLQKHIDIHSGKTPYVCPSCCEGFACQVDLQRHHYMDRYEMPIECSMCKEILWNETELSEHMNTHHVTRQNETQHWERADTHQVTYLHMCSLCDGEFSKASDLNTHLDDISGQSLSLCSYCEKVFTKLSELRSQGKDRHLCTCHLNIMTTTYSSCHLCIQGFDQLEELKVHLTSHAM